MTQYPVRCDKCGIFLAVVRDAGQERANLCYPCYYWRLLKKYGQAIKWLEYRRIAGEAEDVEKWYRWNEENAATKNENAG